jgi:hypothetical protein
MEEENSEDKSAMKEEAQEEAEKGNIEVDIGASQEGAAYKYQVIMKTYLQFDSISM